MAHGAPPDRGDAPHATRFRSLVRDAFWVFVAVAILGGGVAGFQLLQALRDPVQAAPLERVVPSVDVLRLAPHDGPVPIRGEGFVRPFRQIDLAAEVSGRIIELHPAIEARGRFSQGDVLFRLDGREAYAELARAEGNLDSTRARLDLNQTQLARTETLLARGVVTEERLDQLLAEKAELEATLASLRAAREVVQIRLANTAILAPFDGAVLSQVADLGDVVSPGQALATIFTDGQLEVVVPVTEAEAALIPGLFDGGSAPAEVTARFADTEVAWDAVVSRVEPALDMQTRTMTVTVSLVDVDGGRMLETESSLASGTPPALINAFVDVTVDGARRPGLYAVPSASVREGNALWLSDGGILRIVPVTVVHIDGEVTYVTLGRDLGAALLVTSTLDAPVEGSPIRVADTAAGAAE